MRAYRTGAYNNALDGVYMYVCKRNFTCIKSDVAGRRQQFWRAHSTVIATSHWLPAVHSVAYLGAGQPAR